MASAWTTVIFFAVFVNSCFSFSFIFQGTTLTVMHSRLRASPATVLLAKSKKQRPDKLKDAKNSTIPVQSNIETAAPGSYIAEKGSDRIQSETPQQALNAKERIEGFDRNLRQETSRLMNDQQKGAKFDLKFLDDTKIQDILLGKKPVKEEKIDRIRTETGEELLLSEFATGATISPFAIPSNDPSKPRNLPTTAQSVPDPTLADFIPKDGDPKFTKPRFDPMNPPLPSELERQQRLERIVETASEGKGEEFRDNIKQRLAAGDLILPSELDSPPFGQSLFSDFTAEVQDDALFRIQSAFDKGEIPGKTSQQSRSGSKGQDSGISAGMESAGSLEDIVARDLEQLRSKKMKLDNRDEPENIVAKFSRALPETVNSVMGLAVALNFFAVIFFLGWLVVSIFYQFATCGGFSREGGPICPNPLYDQWYALWTPVIQPLLGVLMVGTIIQGTLRTLLGPKEDS